MKKIPFILFSLILGAVILVGCGEWLAKRKAERDDAKKPYNNPIAKVDSVATTDKSNVSTTLLPIDSFILSKEVNGFKMSIVLDTTKCNLLPKPTIDNLVTAPEYRAILELKNDFDIKVTGDKYKPLEMTYKGIKYHASNFLLSPTIENGCLLKVSRDNFIPLHEPSDIKLSRLEALNIALNQAFPTRAQESKSYLIKRYGSYDSIPQPLRYLTIEKPINTEYYQKNLKPNAKFAWQWLNPEKYVQDSLAQYANGELLYLAGGQLAYVFNIDALYEPWTVSIDAINGSVHKFRENNHAQ